MKTTSKLVAVGDDSPQPPSGYWCYLLAYAIETGLLVLTLVAAVWLFVDWVAAPSECLEISSRVSMPFSSSGAAAPGTGSTGGSSVPPADHAVSRLRSRCR